MITDGIAEGRGSIGDNDPPARSLVDWHIVGAAAGANDSPTARHRGEIAVHQDAAAAKQPHHVGIAGLGRQVGAGLARGDRQVDPFAVKALANPIGHGLSIQVDQRNFEPFRRVVQ